MKIMTYSTGNYQIGVKTTNACGTSGMYYMYQYFSCSGGSGSHRSAAVYPNPSKDVLNVRFENPDALPERIELYNENAASAVKSVTVREVSIQDGLKEENTIELDVKDLPRGTYYLHVIPGENSKQETEKIRVVLE